MGSEISGPSASVRRETRGEERAPGARPSHCSATASIDRGLELTLVHLRAALDPELLRLAVELLFCALTNLCHLDPPLSVLRFSPSRLLSNATAPLAKSLAILAAPHFRQFE